MVCRPASQFCCGCSVKFGVTFILCLHLLECLWITIMTGVFVIGKSPSMIAYSFSDIGEQTVNACFGLAGIPIIILGLWGVRNGVEACIRAYWLYMVLAFLLELFYVLHHFIFQSSCNNVDGIVGRQGRAWACGLARVFDISSLIILLSIPSYFIFIVLSYCEDMKEGGAGPELSDLTSSTGKRKRQPPAYADPYSSILGLTGWMSGEYGTIYDSSVAHGLGGGRPIMDG